MSDDRIMRPRGPGIASYPFGSLPACSCEGCVAARAADASWRGRGSGATFNTAECVELDRGEVQTNDAGDCICEACHGDGGARYMERLRAAAAAP